MTLLLFLAGCPKAVREPAEIEGARRLTVLHTNDIHGHYLPEVADWLPGSPSIGGMVRLEQEVAAIRERRARESVLLLDGGDQLTGTPLSDVVVEGVKGGALHAFFALLDYDAWALGNHEFDKGLDNLVGYAAAAHAPVLSANVRSADGKMLLPQQEASFVLERNGVRIGLIGATTGGLKGLMSRADFARIQLRPEVEAVRAEAELLDPETDLLVLVSHVGLENDERIAAAVPQLDLIVGGHSHTRLTEARKVGTTWIVQAGSYTRSLGNVELTVRDDAIASFSYVLRDLVPETATRDPNPKMVALADKYQTELDKIYGEVVSSAPGKLGRDYHHESALGRWVTDALRDTTGADVAFYNGGGLRADIQPGPVTYGALFESFPFKNDVLLFDCTGQEMLGLVLRNLAAEASESRGYISTSGLTWTWRMRDGAPEVGEARVGAAPLDPARTYMCAATSYIVEHHDKHLGFEPRNVSGGGMNDLDAAVAYARKGPVADPGSGRGRRLE